MELFSIRIRRTFQLVSTLIQQTITHLIPFYGQKKCFLNVRLKNIFSNDFKLFLFVYIYNCIICAYPQIDTFLSVNAKKTSHNIF